MNAEFLFEDSLIGLIYERVKKDKIQGEFDVDNCIKETNNQVNAHCEEIQTKKLMTEIHQNITAGFASADANIEYLKETGKIYSQLFNACRLWKVLHSLLPHWSLLVHEPSTKEVLHSLQPLRGEI